MASRHLVMRTLEESLLRSCAVLSADDRETIAHQAEIESETKAYFASWTVMTHGVRLPSTR